MDVEDPVGEPFDRHGRQHPHEAGKHQNLGTRPLSSIADRVREADPVGEVGPVHDLGRHPGARRPFQGTSPRPIGDHGHDRGAEVVASRGIEQRLEVAPAAGGENGHGESCRGHAPAMLGKRSAGRSGRQQGTERLPDRIFATREPAGSGPPNRMFASTTPGGLAHSPRALASAMHPPRQSANRQAPDQGFAAR